MQKIRALVRLAVVLSVAAFASAATANAQATGAFNAAAHDAGALAREAHLANEAHALSDARAAEHAPHIESTPHTSSPHAFNNETRWVEGYGTVSKPVEHAPAVHPSSSEYRAIDTHATAPREVPKVEVKSEPRITELSAKVQPRSSDLKDIDSRGAISDKSHVEFKNEQLANKNNPSQQALKEQTAGRNQPLTNSQSKDLAKYNGMSPVKDPPFDSHGQLVFKKDGKFFTPDVDGHNGGVWKEFSRRGQRIGTLNENLDKIGK